MNRYLTAGFFAGIVCVSSAQAEFQLFPRGPEALKYGAYTGGHAYPYTTAYSYGLSFSPADSWRRDPFAYPQGIYPYRPYNLPITYRVFPRPQTPYIAVPGPDGLPILVRPDAQPNAITLPPGYVLPGHTTAPSAVSGASSTTLIPVPAQPTALQPTAANVALKPQPTTAFAKPGMIRINAPAGADIWVEKQKVTNSFQTPPLSAGETRVYSVRARWTEAGREFEQYRVVIVGAGESTDLQFAREN